MNFAFILAIIRSQFLIFCLPFERLSAYSSSHHKAACPFSATLLSQHAVAPPGPSHSSARRVDALPLLSGVLPTVIFLSRILLTLSIGGSAIATSRFLHLPAEASESRDPIFLVNADFPRRFGTSRYRDFRPISSGSPVPRPEVPRCRLLDLSPFVGSLLTRPTSGLVNLRGPMYRGHYSLRPLWSMPCT
jgi:hypothetical protein